MASKVIITAAVTGGEHTKEATPYLPQTPEEIADAAIESHRAGAAIVHIHVWDEGGRPTQDVGLYERVYALIEERSDVVVNVTTGPGGTPTDDERLRPLVLAPEMASFDAGSMNFADRVFENSPAFLERLGRAMQEHDVKPELEVFDESMIWNCVRLADIGCLTRPLHFQFVLGAAGGAAARAETLVHLANSIPEGSTWGVAGIGRHAAPMAMLAVAMGGHVRVGLEDSIYVRRGELAKSNAQLVERVVTMAELVGRDVASPADAREILGLKGRRGRVDQRA
jgi:3-keto-5-aminohexanoate cleavage enzyme